MTYLFESILLRSIDAWNFAPSYRPVLFSRHDQSPRGTRVSEDKVEEQDVGKGEKWQGMQARSVVTSGL